MFKDGVYDPRKMVEATCDRPIPGYGALARHPSTTRPYNVSKPSQRSPRGFVGIVELSEG